MGLCRDFSSQYGQAVFACAVILLGVPTSGLCEGLKELPIDPKCKYKAGQVWSYKTRPSEEASRLMILSVERFDRAGTIVHISLSKLKVKFAKSKTGYSETVEHMPISEKAMDESVVKKEADGPVPPQARGYSDWREKFDQGKAGVFTIPLSKCVEFLEKTLDSGTKTKSTELSLS